jgi:hypothetical protein
MNESCLPFDTGAAIVAVERRHHGRQVTEVEAAQRPTEDRRQGTRHVGGEVQARQPEPRAEDPGQGQELAHHRATTASREASTRAAKRGGDGTGWHDARIWQIANAKTSKQRGSWDSKARDPREAQEPVPHARRVARSFIDLLLGGGPEPRNRPERWSASTEASEMSPTLRSDSSIFLASDKLRLSGGAAFQNLPSQRPNVTEMEQSITTLAAPCTMTAGPS